jgi:hypothetical protein
MKKIKNSLIVALMFGTLIGYAEEKTNSAEFTNKKIVKVEFKNVKKGQALTIKNENGLIVYSGEIKNSGNYSKQFDLSALENGTYKVELNKDFEIIIKTFNVKDRLVTLLKEENQKIFKPVIRTKGDFLYVSKIEFNHKPLKVIIYYENEILLSDTLKEKEDILKRVYKLSDSEKGDYKVVIHSDERIYVKDFTI